MLLSFCTAAGEIETEKENVMSVEMTSIRKRVNCAILQVFNE